MRKDLEGHVRVVLKVFGFFMLGALRAKMRQGFRDQLIKASAVDTTICVMVDMFCPIHLAFCSSADAMDVKLRAIARGSDFAVRLRTVPGGGPIHTASPRTEGQATEMLHDWRVSFMSHLHRHCLITGNNNSNPYFNIKIFQATRADRGANYPCD